MKIAVYGGSFNPPHLGHREVAELVSGEIRPDKLLVIPDNIAPHKEMADNSPSPLQRLELCRLNFQDIPNTEVSDIEIQREGKSYSIDTFLRLKQMYPEDELYLIIGTDMLLFFEKWYRFEELLSMVTLLAVTREEDDTDEVNSFAQYLREKYSAKVRVIPHSPVEVSSSMVRDSLKDRKGKEYLYGPVYEEIIKNRFYGAKPEFEWLRQQSYSMLDDWRIAHVKGCEQEAVSLAKRWGEDTEDAAEAAILHDITKKCSYEEQLHLSDKYDIVNCKAELAAPKLLHAKTGAAYSRAHFGIPDRIYESIRWHTTAKPDMNLLEKIIYLADYIEPTRDFPGVDELKEKAYKDIDEAMALGLQMSIEDIRSYGTEPYIDTIDACQWYVTKVEKRR